MCRLDRLNIGDTLLKYELPVASALSCSTATHSAMPGQSPAEEFCESLLSSLVTKRGQNRGAVTIDDVDDLYHLISIRKEGHRVNLCRIPNYFVNSVPQRLSAYLNAECVYMPWVLGPEPCANSLHQQVLTPPSLREASRKVVSKKQLRYLSVLHSEQYLPFFAKNTSYIDSSLSF